MLLDNFRSSNDKTELLVLRVKHRPKPPLDPITVGNARSRTRNTGAVFDTMSFEEHVIELCRTAFFHITEKQLYTLMNPLALSLPKHLCMH